MYITAALPETYGSFQKIRDDNYPFNRNFTDYIETIVLLGQQKGLNITQLIGYIEDLLMGDERLPDIPTGEGVVKFRYSIDNDVIESYYRKQDITNRDVTLLIIQMTLRLSVRFGTSLQRLRLQIGRLSEVDVDAPTIQAEPRPVVQTTPTIKPLVEQPKPVEPVVEQPAQTKEDTESVPDVLGRLAKLTERSAQLAADVVETEDVTVETNPALGSFIDLD